MIQKVLKSTRSHVFLLAALLLSSFVLIGCGSGGGGGGDTSSESYDAPKTVSNSPIKGSATNVLIDSATLKGWLNDGLVNNNDNYNDKVVIIEYGSTGDHIPGAIQVGTNDLRGTRLDGLAPAGSLVATGAQIDAVIQSAGIDENTTVVIMTGGSAYLSTRAYWTFRYWGFPQACLKVLDGGKAAWTAAGNTLTSDATVATASTFSVQDMGAINADLRMSIGELISQLDDDTIMNGVDYLTIDARGNGATSGYMGTSATSTLIEGFVVFDGHPAGGIGISQAVLFDSDGTFLPADEIKQKFIDAGWQEGMPVITYCTSGYSCTPIFFALEAILGEKVQVFDGSWSQAGQYAEITTDEDNNGVDDITGAVLPSGSPWDLTFFIDNLGYNVNNGKTLSTIYQTPYSIDLETWYAPGDEETNQVEESDSDYATSGTINNNEAPSAGSDSGGSVGC